MHIALIVSLILALASATSAASVGRIIGGQETSISQYPFMANLLVSQDFSFFLPACGGAIIGQHTILTTASCLPISPSLLRARVGSTFATSGGTVLNINQFIYLTSFNPITYDNDVAILKTESITFMPNAVMPVGFASLNTNLPDDVQVTIAGWGMYELEHSSEELRHTQVRTLNSRVCDTMASETYIPFSMFCTTGSGIFPTPGVCPGDNGSPVLLNNVVVGLVTHPRCGSTSIHTRVSAHSTFIENFLD